MHAGLLDVLHHAADQHLAVAVGDDVDVDLDRVVEEAVEQHRRIVRHLHRFADVARQVGVGMHHFHRAAAEHVARAHHQRIADLARQHQRLVGAARGAVRRLQQAEVGHELLEALAVLGQVDRLGRGADHRHAVGLERARQLQRRLPAVLHDHALGLLQLDDLQHVLEGQRLEVQAVGGVVVGRHRLRVAVDHDGLEPVLAQRQRGVHAAVVELDALADAVRAAAEHHDLAAVGRLRLALVLVGRVHVGGGGGELGGAGVHPLVDRAHAEGLAQRAQRRFVGARQRGQARIGEAGALEPAQALRVEAIEAARGHARLHRHQVLDLVQEPRIDEGQRVHVVHRHAGAERIGDVEDALRSRLLELAAQRGEVVVAAEVEAGRIEAALAGLQAAQRLLQRLLERPADRHHLAHRLHLRGQARVGGGELLEREARDLGDDVVDARLERRRGQAAGDLVLQLVERVADRQLGRDLGDREAGGLRRQRRGTRHPRVHLDHDDAAVAGVDAELHVRAAGVHADLAQHRDRGVAQALVFLVGEGQGRGDGDRVAGVHAHRVEVLDRADDDAVVRRVADHLHLELLPAEHRFLDQHLVRRRQLEAALDDLLELLAVVGDAAAGAAEGEARADDGREADVGLDRQRLLVAARDLGLRAVEADLRHRLLEQLAVLGHADRVARGADQLDAVLLQHAVVGKIQRAVQRGLAAHRRQQRVRALLGDDLLDRGAVDRLDVDRVGHARVGHDRRGVAVHQHDAVALVAQRLAGLRAGVVELAGLADHDRAGADDQDGLDVCALRHVSALLRACGVRARRASTPRSGRRDRKRRAAPGSLPDAPGS